MEQSTTKSNKSFVAPYTTGSDRGASASKLNDISVGQFLMGDMQQAIESFREALRSMVESVSGKPAAAMTADGQRESTLPWSFGCTNALRGNYDGQQSIMYRLGKCNRNLQAIAVPLRVYPGRKCQVQEHFISAVILFNSALAHDIRKTEIITESNGTSTQYEHHQRCALQLYNMALGLVAGQESRLMKFVEIMALNNIGCILYKSKKKEESLEKFSGAAKACEALIPSMKDSDKKVGAEEEEELTLEDERKFACIFRARVLCNMGRVHFDSEDFATALDLNDKALSVVKTVPSSSKDGDANVKACYKLTQSLLFNIGLLNYKMGRLAESLGTLDQALKLFGKEDECSRDFNAAFTLHLLVKESSNVVDEKLLELLKNLHAKREAYGHSHIEVLSALSSLGKYYFKGRNYSNAAAFFRECLCVQEALLGEFHPSAVITLHSLGQCLQQGGDATSAIICYRKALDMRKSLANKLRTSVFATILFNMGQTYQAVGKLDVAVGCYHSALKLLSQAQNDGSSVVQEQAISNFLLSIQIRDAIGAVILEQLIMEYPSAAAAA